MMTAKYCMACSNQFPDIAILNTEQNLEKKIQIPRKKVTHTVIQTNDIPEDLREDVENQEPELTNAFIDYMENLINKYKLKYYIVDN